MRRKIGCLLVLLMVLAGIGFSLVYTRPMTLEQLCPGIRLEECQEIQASFRRGQTGEETTITLQKEDEAFAQMTRLLHTATFRRSLLNLFPLGGKSHALQPEDFKWLLLLEFGDTRLPDGTQGSGMLVTFMERWKFPMWVKPGVVRCPIRKNGAAL